MSINMFSLAAGLGNGFSDVAGIGLSHHIEFYCSRFIGEMKLTPEQFNLRIVNWIIIFVRVLEEDFFN